MCISLSLAILMSHFKCNIKVDLTHRGCIETFMPLCLFSDFGCGFLWFELEKKQQ